MFKQAAKLKQFGFLHLYTFFKSTSVKLYNLYLNFTTKDLRFAVHSAFASQLDLFLTVGLDIKGKKEQRAQ